ncbi:MAG: chromate transporter [Clostridia bacterium]|nr:chromate transporter [Clostridia bacterium]
MFRIGLLTFGGGYAMIGVITDEFVDKKHWITNEEMLDMIAISESLPGAIAINTSISVGYKLKGIKGAVTSVLGAVLPSIIIITAVTYLYGSLPENSPVWLFIKGIRAGVIGLLLAMILKLGKSYEINAFSICIFAGAFLTVVMTEIPVIFIIIAGALLGFIYGRVKKKDAA